MAYDPIIQKSKPDWQDGERWPLWKAVAFAGTVGLMCWSAFSWILIEVLL